MQPSNTSSIVGAEKCCLMSHTSCACFLYSAGSPVCVHEGRATGAEPDTSSWQGGKLLEMTAVGSGGGAVGVGVGEASWQGCFMQTHYRDHCVLGELEQSGSDNRNH